MEKVENSEIYVKLETAANQFTLKCLLSTVAVMAIVWFLNIIGVFIVDYRLAEAGFGFGIATLLITGIVCKVCGISKFWIKYFLLFMIVLATTVLGIMLTYHTVLLCVLPLLYSAQYNRKMVILVYLMTAVGTFVSVMAGYFWGLCDANMVVLTVNSRSYYVDDLTKVVQFGPLNEHPWITLPLYYVLPRIIILFTMIPVVLHIADGIVRKAEREAELKYFSEVDDMTKMYNRNKYRQMIKEYYPTVSRIGVIFWDVNGLKETNDSKGHEQGDRLITSIATLIRELMGDHARAYRIGGDEFVMIIEETSEKELEQFVAQWKDALKQKNDESDFALSAAMGYASGNGRDIEKIIKRADHDMYKEKQQKTEQEDQ